MKRILDASCVRAGDIIVAHPDHPGQDVCDAITLVGVLMGRTVVEYIDDRGFEGRSALRHDAQCEVAR